MGKIVNLSVLYKDSIFQEPKKEATLKSRGTIKFFNAQKGFGFITPDNGGKDIFVHANNVQGDPKSLREGQKVEYVEGPGRKGPEATDVSIL
jgi:CspA family cold shock protein